jgi:hypothetical protein
MGEARCAFEKVARVWSHTNISRHRKIKILDSLVLSKLLYGLESLFLYTADRARIDGFYCRCLRRIFKIPVAFVSRVSNARVYQLAEARTPSSRLQQRQMELYAQIAGEEASSLQRRVLLNAGDVTPRDFNSRRNVGRPRLQWGSATFASLLGQYEDNIGELRSVIFKNS